MVDGKEVDPGSNMGNGKGKCGTNGHTVRMGIPFHPAIDLSEVRILQKR